MGDITTVITVDAEGAIGQVDALAEAVGKLAADWDAAMEKVSGAGMAGPEKMVAGWDSAAADIGAAMDKIAASAGKLGDLGKAGGDSAAQIAAIGDAGKAAAAGLDSLAGSAGSADEKIAGLAGAGDEAASGLGKLADAGKAAADSADLLAKSSSPAADGIKGVGASAKDSQAFLAEYNAEMKAMADIQAESSRAMKAYSAEMAASNDLLAANKTSLATTSIEQDAAVAQSAKASALAQKQAAADAAASAKSHEMLLLGLAGAAAYGTYKAAALQTGVTRLYTTAGESKANLPGDTAGILNLSGATNTTQAQLAQGAYMISSAGFHGAGMLGILKAAAQGAQAEGAPLSETGNALTSLLNAYSPGIAGKSAAVQSRAAMQAMDEIITMVGQGKMTMAGAVGALPAVLPVASAAHIAFPQVAGAIATMTSMGMSPDWASQDLRHTIGALQNPNTVQTAEMQQLGLNPVSIAKNLGSQGLTGTLQHIQTAVMKSMGPAGLVMLKTFNQSQSAAQDATIMLKAMPPALQSVAKGYLDGTVSAKQFNKEVFSGPEPAAQKNLLQQFATTANLAHGFNAVLKSGQPDAQVFSAAMSKILGGTVGLQTALMLTGQHMPAFKANVDSVAASASHAGDSVKGWAQVQGTLNFQLGSFEKSLEAVSTQAGEVLLPAVTTALHGLSGVAGFFTAHPALTKAATIGGGILGAGYALQKVEQPAVTALQGVGKVAQVLHIPGLDKLATLGQGSGGASGTAAAAGLDRVAGAADAAAGALERVGAASDKAAVGEDAAGAAGDKAAIGETADAKALSPGASGLSGAAGPLEIGLVIGMIIKALGDKLSPSGTPSGKVSQQLQKQEFTTPGPAQQLHPSLLGGFEGWLTTHIGMQAGKGINDVLHYIATGGAPGPAAKAPPAAPEMPALAGAKAAAAQGAAGVHPAPVPATPDMAALAQAKARAAQGAAVIAGPAPAAPEMPALASAKARAAQDIAGISQAMQHVRPAKIPPPDLSALASAKARAAQDIAGIGQAMQNVKPAKIPAPDMAALDAAKAKAASDGAGIVSGAQAAVNRPVKVPPPDMAALAAAKGTAAADGAAISAGLAGGILAGEGAVVAAATQVAAAAESAIGGHLQIRSPSKVTHALGTQAAAGLAAGLSGGTGTVKNAAVSLTAATITSLTQGLQGGKSAIDAALQAITGKGSRPQDITTITSTITTLEGDVKKAFSAGQIGAGQESALTRMLTADNKKLQAEAAKRTALETQITDATQVATTEIANNSIMGAATAVPAGSAPPQSWQALVQGQQFQAQSEQQFAAALLALKKGGLNATDLNQITGAGAAAGLPVAQGIEQGGKQAIAQLNQVQAQIHAAAAKVGDVGGPAMYQAGVQVGQGLATGLKSQLKTLDGAMAQLADTLVAAVKRDLKIKSPSQVFADEVGAMIPAGVAEGIRSGEGVAFGAMREFGQHMTDVRYGGQPQPAAPLPPGWAGTGGAVHHHYHYSPVLHVQGNVHTEEDLLDALQERQLFRASNNWQGGWQLAGRAG